MKANGNPTPRRPIEREYLATLNAAVPVDTWQAICKRAADDALAGDAKARDWLAKWLLGLESREDVGKLWAARPRSKCVSVRVVNRDWRSWRRRWIRFRQAKSRRQGPRRRGEGQRQSNDPGDEAGSLKATRWAETLRKAKTAFDGSFPRNFY